MVSLRCELLNGLEVRRRIRSVDPHEAGVEVNHPADAARPDEAVATVDLLDHEPAQDLGGSYAQHAEKLMRLVCPPGVVEQVERGARTLADAALEREAPPAQDDLLVTLTDPLAVHRRFHDVLPRILSGGGMIRLMEI